MRKARPSPRPDLCFRCDEQLEPDGGLGGWFHSAVIVLENADQSFSGTFRLPLCYGCSLVPHNANYERVKEVQS